MIKQLAKLSVLVLLFLNYQYGLSQTQSRTEILDSVSYPRWFVQAGVGVSYALYVPHNSKFDGEEVIGGNLPFSIGYRPKADHVIQAYYIFEQFHPMRRAYYNYDNENASQVLLSLMNVSKGFTVGLTWGKIMDFQLAKKKFGFTPKAGMFFTYLNKVSSTGPSSIAEVRSGYPDYELIDRITIESYDLHHTRIVPLLTTGFDISTSIFTPRLQFIFSPMYQLDILRNQEVRMRYKLESDGQVYNETIKFNLNNLYLTAGIRYNFQHF